jgi:hypothetical protein
MHRVNIGTTDCVCLSILWEARILLFERLTDRSIVISLFVQKHSTRQFKCRFRFRTLSYFQTLCLRHRCIWRIVHFTDFIIIPFCLATPYLCSWQWLTPNGSKVTVLGNLEANLMYGPVKQNCFSFVPLCQSTTSTSLPIGSLIYRKTEEKGPLEDNYEVSWMLNTIYRVRQGNLTVSKLILVQKTSGFLAELCKYLNIKQRDWQSLRYLWADCLSNVRSTVSRNSMGLHGRLQE